MSSARSLPHQHQLTNASSVSAVFTNASGLPPALTATPTLAPCGLAWHVIPSLDPGLRGNNLFSVQAISADDIWAVGYFLPNDSLVRTLIEHWDGTQWSYVSSPSPGSSSSSLSDVSAASVNNIWAVGSSVSNTSPGSQTLIEHWDGTGWNVIPSPNAVVSGTNVLLGVAAVSANDVWAVGYFYTGGYARTLTEHWDGQQWSIIPSPNPTLGAANNQLWDVVAVSTKDVWAVGYYGAPSLEQPLTMQWDGTAWRLRLFPASVNGTAFLYGITAISGNDIWAVGNNNTSTFVAHWDGVEWGVVPSPNVGTSTTDALAAVAAVSDNDVWAVGYYCCTGSGTLVEHWDGVQWSIVSSPSPGSGLNHLYGVSAMSTLRAIPYATSRGTGTALGVEGEVPRAVEMPEVWAVGQYLGATYLTLTERYNDPCITPSPTATGTSPTRTPTSTSTVSPTPSITLTPTTTFTATSCPMTFSDVRPTDYFYEPVRYLYCRGVISGYADNTFRPYNNTTRGQLAKIVVLAEGWPIYTPPNPTFTDVLESHPFYSYIETAYFHDIVSGYGCGVGCLEYRPSSDVTRGQLAKIVVLAEGWAIYAPPGPTFRDVPLSDPFYGHIETAYSHGIISGYECGAGCLEFRTGNSATRGADQQDRIPGCDGAVGCFDRQGFRERTCGLAKDHYPWY